MLFFDIRPTAQITFPTAAQLGWNRRPETIAGLPVYETDDAISPRLYATSRHGWEFTILPQEEEAHARQQGPWGGGPTSSPLDVEDSMKTGRKKTPIWLIVTHNDGGWSVRHMRAVLVCLPTGEQLWQVDDEFYIPGYDAFQDEASAHTASLHRSLREVLDQEKKARDCRYRHTLAVEARRDHLATTAPQSDEP